MARKPFMAASAVALACGLSLAFASMGADASAATRLCKAKDFSSIEAEVEGAEHALAQREYARADDLAALALRNIGSRYYDPDSLDDTGQRLSLADWSRRQGDEATSAKIRVRMARSRLQALGRKSGC